jgi:hypothetical protein
MALAGKISPFYCRCIHTVQNVCQDQYSETNVMHFLFGLLRIKDLYMFRALLVHPQQALLKRHLVYCVRYVSWLHQD